MNGNIVRWVVPPAMGLCSLSCGNNLNSPSTILLNPPQALQALSVNDTTVALRWTAPSGSVDSSFVGYQVEFGTRKDTLPRTSLRYDASPLGPGATLFKLFSRDATGKLSESSANIQWAPAARFDSAFVLYEYDFQNLGRQVGLHLGNRSTNPYALSLNDPSAESDMDIYLFGGSSQPLALRSASLYLGSFSVTSFSTRSDASSSLDLFLSSFPASDTFTLDNVQVTDNTVYYALLSHHPLLSGEKNYARIQVRALGGSYPDRSVAIRVSLQRVPGVAFASLQPSEESRTGGLLAMLLPR
jgi:hypothetical protein